MGTSTTSVSSSRITATGTGFSSLTRQFQIAVCAADLKLFRHLFAEGVAPELVFCNWIQSLFCDCPLFVRSFRSGQGQQKLPLPLADLYLRLWECVLLERSPKMLIRFAAAVFAELQDPLRRRAGDRVVSLLLEGKEGDFDCVEYFGKEENCVKLWER